MWWPIPLAKMSELWARSGVDVAMTTQPLSLFLLSGAALQMLRRIKFSVPWIGEIAVQQRAVFPQLILALPRAKPRDIKLLMERHAG